MCFINCKKKLDESIRKMHWYDISLIKVATAAAVLLIAKYFPIIITGEWYHYVIIALFASFLPMKHMFCNKDKAKKSKK